MSHDRAKSAEMPEMPVPWTGRRGEGSSKRVRIQNLQLRRLHKRSVDKRQNEKRLEASP